MHAIQPHAPGAPIVNQPPLPELVVIEQGNYLNGEGARMSLREGFLIIDASFGDSEMHLGIEICRLLEAVQSYNRAEGN